MSLIQVKFDNTLQQSDIIIHLSNSSKAEAGENYIKNQQEVQQTLIYGIQSPLIMINKIVVDFTDVIDFELKCTDITPTVSIIARDRYKLSSTLDTPGIDNELRIQILPKFEDKYKKINLTFYITSIRFDNDIIFIKGEYKAPMFTSSNFKSFGELSTYGLFKTIATETGLGFASNMEENENDKRFIYCDNKPYLDLLKHEIQRSGIDMQICDYWIDWWNNLVLADIYERYNATDTDDDMQIWIADQNKEIMEGSEMSPVQIIASFTNHPAIKASELYVKNYHISNKPGSQMYQGTDRVYTTYEQPKSEHMDYLIQDGDVQQDIFTKYEYLGEVYGEYNYLVAGKKREAFLQKIQSNETVEIVLQTPLLGVMRGNRVNFLWYINNTSIQNYHTNLKEGGQMIENIETNIPLNTNNDEIKSYDEFILDTSISGQYLVMGCKMKYIDAKWEYTLILKRPTSMKPKILNIPNE